MNNVANDPAYANVIESLGECERWMIAIDDKGLIDEKDLINTFYPNVAQLTNPMIEIKKGKVHVSCQTPALDTAIVQKNSRMVGNYTNP